MSVVTELLNLWGETVEQCAARMVRGAQLSDLDLQRLTQQEITLLGTARERAKQQAEKIASMARENVRPGVEPLPGQLDPAFYLRVADYLARDV